MKLPKSLRLGIVTVIVLVIYKVKTKSESFRKAVILSNDVPVVLSKAVVDHIERAIVSINWENMLSAMESIIPSNPFEKIPNLFSIDTPVLVQRVRESVQSSFDQHVDSTLTKLNEFLDFHLDVAIEVVMAKLREEITSYTSDYDLLDTFEKNMATSVKNISSTTRSVLTQTSTARFNKLRSIFDEVLNWKLISYERFLHHALRTRVDFDPGSQLKTWVELETQEVVGSKHVGSYMNMSLFEQYMGNSASFMQLLASKYLTPENDIYDDLDSFFSRRFPSIEGILASQYSRLYLLRTQAIDDDTVLDDSQKRVLKSYARLVSESSRESRLEDSTSKPSLSLVKSFYTEYASRLLDHVRVAILVAFLEYESISLRARADGRQTCIVQFYQMRAALGEAFFFEYARERSFDLDLTKADFEGTLAKSLSESDESMLSLVDLSHVLYMYDNARTFISSRLTLFFRDDIILLSKLKPMVALLHEDYASIIPLRVQEGIDEEIDSEKSTTSVSVLTAFESFLGDMEFSFVMDLIKGSSDSILKDLVAKMETVYEEFSHVSTNFVGESLQPFTFEYFESLTTSFITDEEINYIAMKKFVVDTTNAYASGILESTRATYLSLIDSLFSKVDNFISGVYSDLDLVVENASSRVSPDRRTALRQSLSSFRGSMLSFSSTMSTSSKTALEEVLGSSLVELEGAQGTRLRNFFNTKIQLIKDDFAQDVGSRMERLFEFYLGRIERVMLDMSSDARSIFREHVDQLFHIEKAYRDAVVTDSKPALDELVVHILAEYNIVSFGERQSTLRIEMRNTIRSSAAQTIEDRERIMSNIKRVWSNARSEFRDSYLATGTAMKQAFRKELAQIINDAKSMAVEIMGGGVSEFLAALDRDLYDAMDERFEEVIDSTIGSSDNDLPESLDLTSIVFTPGIMDLTDSPEIPADAFIRSYREPDENTQYDEDGNILPEVDSPSGMTTNEITLTLVEWDLYLQGKIEEIIYDVSISMEDELIQNTCRHNKPPCREGWVEYVNQPWGVPCCRFDPVSQGFLSWQVAGMLAVELVLGFLLDLESLTVGNAKRLKSAYGKYTQKKLDDAAKLLDDAAKGLDDVGKALDDDAGRLVTKYSRKGHQMMVKSFNKYAGKTPARMTKAIRMSKSLGKSMAKAASKAGAKMGARAASKMAVKVASMGTKMLSKLSLGPIGVAIMVFDFVSLILDLWDPAGYNDGQTAGIVRVERDETEKYYSEELHNMGFDHPLLADPMFMMSPAEQNEFYMETQASWYADKLADFMSANEARLDLMPEYEAENEVLMKYDDFALELDENPNLLTTLMAQKLENVFLQDLSVRQSYKNPFTEGGPRTARKHLRQRLPDSGILEIALNETGVAAYNHFMSLKADFMNSLKFNPMYRYIKREKDYTITKDSTQEKFFRQGTKCVIDVVQTAGTYSTAQNPYYEYDVREDCVKPQYPPLTPTLEGSIVFADALPYPNGSFGTEIRENVADGWALTKVDAEEEFWVQYEPDKSLSEMLDRKSYQRAHEEIAEASRQEHELLMDGFIAAHLEMESVSDPENKSDVPPIGDVKVVHLAKDPSNWTIVGLKNVLKYPLSPHIDDSEKITYTLETLPVIPSWVEPYEKLRSLYEAEAEVDYALIHAENQRLIGEAYTKAHADEQLRLEEKASAEGLTVEEVVSQESVAGRTSEPDNPEFAVFLHGFGQTSPLYNIYKDCQNLGRGVSYNAEHGLCNFTREYCNRYGVDFFFNDELGVYDCQAPRGLIVSEYIFGTTISRSARRGYRYLTKDGSPDPNAPNKQSNLGSSSYSKLGSSSCLSKIGSCRRALGSRRMPGGVQVKQVQNGDHLNYVETATTLDVIGKLGLSGF